MKTQYPMKTILLLLLLIKISISYQSIFKIKLQPTNSSSSKNRIQSNSTDLTVDGQSIHINQNQINLITHDTSIHHHQLQNCPKHYLFSISPSILDSSLIFQTDHDPLESWKDELNSYVSQLQEIETSLQTTTTGSSTEQIVLRSTTTNSRLNECQRSGTRVFFCVNHTALVLVPYLSLKEFTERLPNHMELLIHLYPNKTDFSNPYIRSKTLKRSSEKLLNEVIKIHYKPKIDKLISSLNLNEILKYTRTVVGIDEPSKWITRHTFSDGILLALDWLKDRFESGAVGMRCGFEEYQLGFAPNLVCKILATDQRNRGDGKERVVVSAHLDSRGDFGNVFEPGTDDNAFGCSVLLSISKSIQAHQLSLKKDLYFVVFSGTHQGSWGSLGLLNSWKDQLDLVLLHLDLSMIGYRVPGESMQLGLPIENRFNRVANWFVGNITNLYLPELLIGPTPVRDLDSQRFERHGILSTIRDLDSQRFGTHGILSTSLFERAGKIGNPFYHTSLDLIGKPGYDLVQVLTIGKALYATVLELVL
ncbi:uncharacterized protein MELLADRAFT_107375 [Melampsora larici-populina 98AG31]|uniref:Peptide hydrolase n=1 Tax=Melampsora larici-populina (strain 98AG31 / pathotype 3-4-7) TaxID=747676 RepID=F4RPK7_MELLP|nr:uncharacterized protein MELLADRAFT_107375 [Melampsora larici-populina 98AG31]EGG05550.1 hypothetical protein MELLADRAFT_107375 [Melampsora larici-populina 98AG31]